jgi:hypothetical protein
LLRRTDLQEIRDRLYVLEAALMDARTDLAEAASLDAYPEVFSVLAQAVEQAVALRLEPRAVGSAVD